MNPFEALLELPNLVDNYKATAERLIQVERELLDFKSQQYVPLSWVAAYWSVSINTASEMIKVLPQGRGKAFEVKMLCYGSKVVRYRKADIERITNASLINVRDYVTLRRANEG